MQLPVMDANDAGLWYAGGLKFRCTCCGNCCTGPTGYVWVSDEEIHKLADHLGEPEVEVRRRFVRKIGKRQSFKERREPNGDYDCVFLKPLPGDDPNGKRVRGCSIYEVRPLQCRTWPFWDGLLDEPESWDSAAEHCPGMNRGKSYDVEHIERMRTADEWPNEPPSSK
ncbi:MAG: YkgJ family cysteine cluster protein [Planctomycetota bacterium]